MAHIKCRYTKYECGEAWEFGKDGKRCDLGKPCCECDNLDSMDCFFEATRKNIDYDGHSLIVGKDFYALSEWDSYDPRAGFNYIDALEIDGEQIIPEQ